MSRSNSTCRCSRPSSTVPAAPALRLPNALATVLRSPGRPLDAATRDFMERRFGEDLGDIRLHTDTAAAQSARQLSARAFTVGQHIVFGSGAHRADAPAGHQTLAHELTHALQQRQPGGSALGTAQREGEARRAASSIDGATPMPHISAASPAISRDPEPGAEDDASFEASLAELSCDIAGLCRLSAQAPDAVSPSRVLRAYRACHPGASMLGLVGGNPCLSPNFGRPAVSAPAAPGPRRAPGAATAVGGTPAPAAATAGGLSLPSTTVAFGLGAAAVSVNLPASVALRLPVPFSGAEGVVFGLNASPSEFSFSVSINEVPHVRIIAKASMTTEGRGAAGLTVQTTRTVCSAVDAAAARAGLTAAGTRLRDAIQAAQTPPPPDPEAGRVSRAFAPHARYGEVASAIANVHSEIERVGAPCKEIPVASIDFGAQGQLTTPDVPPSPSSMPPANFIGGALRLHF